MAPKSVRWALAGAEVSREGLEPGEVLGKPGLGGALGKLGPEGILEQAALLELEVPLELEVLPEQMTALS